MLDTTHNALIALTGQTPLYLLPQMANRHGIITGATGTGKTVTLQTLTETFSQMGVPVFAADIKGDFSGIAAQGGNKESINKRVEAFGLAQKGFSYQAFPVQFWDVLGKNGTPIRATLQDMGPILLSRLLDLNDTQSSVLIILFKVAQDKNLPLIDLKDMQKLLEYTTNNTDSLNTTYGNLSSTTLGTIQRQFIALEHEGANIFFGEPCLDVNDLMLIVDGKGVVNILDAKELMLAPRIYSTFLLWLLTTLLKNFPEVGDLEKPKLVFFFDEAHLLFTNAPKVFLEKVEQVVRLIRSKGVGIYFISQSPADIPDSILGQLGNRIQHALRAYTPKDQKAVKTAAESFRTNPAINTATAISELETGEALLSLLDAKGAPQMVERGYIVPPQGYIGPLDEATRAQITQRSPLNAKYGRVVDSQSAFEILSELPETSISKKERDSQEKDAVKAQKEEEKARQAKLKEQQKEQERLQKEIEKNRVATEKAEAKRYKTIADTAQKILVPIAKSFLRGLFKK